MKQIKSFLLIKIAMIMVLFAGCAFQKDEKAPEAQIPVIMSITPDTTTLLNIQKELTVTVEVEDGGVLTYQWYIAKSKLSKGTAIENANTQSFIPDVTKIGTLYYYCIINNKLGESSRSVISPLITYTVKENISAKSPVIIEQPTAQSLEMGKNFVLNVVAYSPDNGVLTYQWYFAKNGNNEEEGGAEETPVKNATEANYEGSVTKDTIGTYWCVVTSTIEDNGDGGVKSAQTESNKVQVKNNIVNAATPIILKQPEKLTLNFDEKFALNVIAYSVDNGTLSYQWYKDEKIVEGATSSTYKGIVSSTILGDYYCEVTSTITDNGDGGVKSAKVKTETVTIESTAINAQKPVIQQMPVNVSAEYGIVFTLSVIAHSSDSGKLTYQWYKDNQKIAGASGSSYIGTVSAASLGAYYCEVTNTITDNGDGGEKSTTETTSIAIISKNIVNANAPIINQNPDSVSSVFGESFTLSVAAYSVDNGKITYQWYKNEKPVEGAVSAKYTGIISAQTVGDYYCEVTNTITDNGDGGNKNYKVKTEIKTLAYTVINAVKPEILLQPENVVTAFGNDFEFTVIAKASDNGTLSYKWFRIDEEGEPQEIASITGNKITGIMSDSVVGSYYCVITNTIDDNGDGGKKSDSVTTNTVLLAKTVINALTPVITNQPLDSVLYVPAIKVLFAGATTFDDGILSYQWYSVENGESEGTAIEGATEARYKIYAGEEFKKGYYCVVTNTLADNGDGGVKTASVRSYTALVDAVSMEDVVSAPDFTVQPTALNIAPYNQSIKLSCKAEAGEGTVFYRWYKSIDGTTATGTPVSGATSAVFNTPVYTEKGIYYYYCVATNVFNDVKSAAVISDVVSVAYTGLPTLYLNTEVPTANITKENYVFGDFKLISKDFGTTEYTFKKEKDGEKKEGIKGRGNSSWYMPKKGFSIKFDTKQSLFGLSKAKKWCIIANYPDKTLIRNRFVSIIGKEIFNAEWNPSFVSVDVIMNGEYRGNYIFCERNTLSEGRIDVQDISDVDEKLAQGKESKIDDSNGDGQKDLKDGGFLIEAEISEGRAKDNDFYFLGTQSVYFCLKDPDKVSDNVKTKVQSLVSNAENVLYDIDYTDSENGWRKYIEEGSVVDWYLINEFTKNTDAKFVSSVYMYYNPVDEKLHFGPIWDFDISCGNINYNDCDDPTGYRIKDAVWISRMFSDEEFISCLKVRWNDIKSNLYQLINTRIQELETENVVSARYNFEKWTILGTYVWPNADGYENRTTYQSEVQYLQNWLNERYNWFDSAINEL